LMMDNMTVTQAQAAASLLGLSGGTLICSDRLPDLEPARLDILRKVMPPFGEAARPVDLWETDRHTTFALPVKRPFGEWIVLGLFNPSEKEPVEKSVSLERLRLDPAKTYVAWDFWGERLHSEIRGAVTARLAPASGLLLAIHEMATAPFVIGTDRHVTQGGVELEAVTWDAAAETLRGVSLGPAGTTHRVYVYLPGDGKRPEPPYVHRDFPGFTQRMLSPRIVRVQVRFDGTDRVSWQVPRKDVSA
jgi:hypothetical protein